MAELYSSQVNKQKIEKKKDLQETLYRLTAPVHVTLNSYKEHERIEGYYEFKDYGHIFKCDRLLKLETIYGKVQMGYNPNRGRSFIFANMKTNLYDTVSSRYQKEMKEYQQRAERKKGNENRAYVSKRYNSAAVLFEKAENKPWSVKSMEPYFKNTNMDALLKVMPYLDNRQEREQLEQTKSQIKQLQEQVRKNGLEGKREENAQLNRQMTELSEESEMLQSVLHRKDAGRRGFIRKINYAFDIEKKEMFDYYREQRLRTRREETEAISRDENGRNSGDNGNGGNEDDSSKTEDSVK